MWSARCGNCSTSVGPSGGRVVAQEGGKKAPSCPMHGGDSGSIKFKISWVKRP